MSSKQARQKHVPQRSCMVCRRKTDKRLLTRLVCTPDEGVVVDLTGKRSGRGAYLCNQTSCWDKALNSTLVNQALNTKMTAEQKEAVAAHRLAADPKMAQ